MPTWSTGTFYSTWTTDYTYSVPLYNAQNFTFKVENPYTNTVYDYFNEQIALDNDRNDYPLFFKPNGARVKMLEVTI